MNDQPSNQSKSNRARERYAKLRRRQRAVLTVFGLLAISLIAVLILIVNGLRSCSLSLPVNGSFKREAQDERWARELTTHDFQLAPWFLELGNDRLYTASDTSLSVPSHGNYRIDRLEAFALADSTSVWQTPANETFSDFLLGDSHLAGIHLRLADQLQLNLSAYEARTGIPAWNLAIDNAENAMTTVIGKAAIIGYRLPDGYRLVGYNLQTQAKAWGMRLPFDGLLGDEFSGGPAANLQLYQTGEILAYWRMNVVGLVATGTGERLREYAAPGYILKMVIDADSQVCYLLISGNQTGTYLVQSLPFSGRGAQEVARFESAALGDQLLGILASRLLLAAAGGKLALAYPLPEDSGGRPRTQLVCFDRSGVGAQTAAELDGVAWELMALPARPDEFLLVQNPEIDESTHDAKGPGELWRIRLSDNAIWQSAKFRRPVISVEPFKEDCLVLLDGGEIYSFVAEADAVKKLRKARYPVLSFATSPDRQHVAVYSTTQRYAANKPGQPLQVIIFE